MRRGKLFLLAAVLCTALCACGGGGGGAGPVQAGGDSGASTSGTGSGSVPPPRARLFVSDSAYQIVAMFDTLSPSSAGFASATTLKVPGLGEALALDSQRDLLYLVVSGALCVYEQAGAMSAQSLPARCLRMPPQMMEPKGLFLDEATDTLYVSGRWQGSATQGQVMVIGGISTASGTASPVRTMTFDASSADYLALDLGRSLMYVGSWNSPRIWVFSNPTQAAGAITPIRSVYAPGASTGAFALDAARDRLYAGTEDGICVLAQVSTAAPVQAKLAGLDYVLSVAVDPVSDRLYAGSHTKGYVFDHASTLETSSAAAGVAVMGGPAGWIVGFAFP